MLRRNVRLDLWPFWRYFPCHCAPRSGASKDKRKLIATERRRLNMKDFCLALALAFLICPAVAAQAAPASTSSSGVEQAAGSNAAVAPGATIQPATQPKVTAYTLSPQL